MGAAVAWAPEPADPFAACHARFEQVLQVAGSQELPTGRGPAWSCKKLLFLRSFPPGGARRGHVRNCCFSEASHRAAPGVVM